MPLGVESQPLSPIRIDLLNNNLHTVTMLYFVIKAVRMLKWNFLQLRYNKAKQRCH